MRAGDAGPDFQPSEAWIDEFKRQFTDVLRHDLRRYASWRTHGVIRAGGNVSSTYVDDLVADAVADTLGGVVEWKPDAVSLQKHLEDTLKYRTRDQRRRAMRFQHAPLDAVGSPAEARATAALVEASLLHDRTGASVDDTIFAREVIGRLRELVASDVVVTCYLDAMATGARTPSEIMEATSLPPKAFRNARDRLRRYAEQLEHFVSPTPAPRGVRA